MRNLIAACGLLFLAQANATGAASEVTSGLEKLIERGEVRAAVVGLYANGKPGVVGLGRMGRADDRVPGADTVFEIGSISKVFTALLAQVQVEAGRLTWDDSIASRLPQVKFASEQVGAITLRELATHTSGLPRIPDNLTVGDALDPYAGYGREELESFLANWQPDALDKTSAYSNLGAGLLGEIAADAAGSSYAAAMERDVLRPLGMTSSAVGLPDRLQGQLAAGFSQGADMPNWDGFDALAGAGAIVSSVTDMLRFAALNLNSGGPLAQAMAAIRQPQQGVAMGLGWQIAGDEEDPVFWHNGGTGGYASFLALKPRTGEALVLLTASTAYSETTNLGMDKILGRQGAPSPVATSGSLDNYAGTFKLAEGFMLKVFARDGELFAQATGQGAFPLTADGEHRFVFAPAAIVITFNQVAPGPAQSISMIQSGRTTEAPRVADDQGPRALTAIELPAEALDEFEGRFKLAPGVVIRIEARAGQLYAQLTGQPAYPVFPYQSDGFFFRVVDAQLQFERDAQGRIAAVVLHQGVEQRATRID